MTRKIPIRNLYYLLCYAWDVLDERDDTLVSELDGLISISRTLGEVSTIPIRSATFTQLQLHGRLNRYRLPTEVCRLIHDQLVVDEATGEIRFRDYVEDEKRMARLFEAFVRNFYD